MSHFVLFVIGDDIEDQLAPYNEQDEKFCEFCDETEELQEEWKNRKVEHVKKLDTGEVDLVWGDKAKDWICGPKSPRIFDDRRVDSENLPEGFELVDIPVKEMYGSFEEFAEDWHGYRKNEQGLYGYHSNPNAKWDWYQVGGRWSGWLRIKPDAEGEVGSPGVFGKDEPRPDEHMFVDRLQIGDLDIEWMENYEREKAYKLYDELTVFKREYPLYKFWSECLAKVGEDYTIEQARAEYHAQPERDRKALNEVYQSFFGMDAGEILAMGREAYAESKVSSAFSPYAMLINGKWVAKGEMGWFGMSNDDHTQDDWDNQVRQYLKSLDPDIMLTVVDCHI